METKVSIVVPVYNVEEYLQGCLDSILAQTYKNIEIIVIDDGSTDNSGYICDQYAILDARIKVIHKENGGISDARNRGLLYCTGDIVGFVDSDDYVSKYFVENLLLAFSVEDAEIAVGRFRLTHNRSQNIQQLDTVFCPNIKSVFSGAESINIFLQSVIDVMECKTTWENSLIRSNVCDKLFKMSLFRGVQFPEGKKCEDLWLIYELLRKAKKVVLINTSDYYYYQRLGSTMNSTNAEVTTIEIEAYSYFYSTETDEALKRKLSLIILRICRQRYINIIKYDVNVDKKGYVQRIAKKHVWLAFSPFRFREWGYWLMLSYFPVLYERKRREKAA